MKDKTTVRFPLSFLFDGAMGTYYSKKTGEPAWKADQAVLTDFEQIKTIHREYIEAGSNALKTATFSLSKCDPANLQEADDVIDAACLAATAAVKESKKEATVFGDLGPVLPGADPAVIYPALADRFARNGISHLLFETLSSGEGLEEAFAIIRKNHPDLFLLVSFAAGADGLSALGVPAIHLLEQMDQCPSVDAIGLNCLCGPGHMYSIVRDLPEFSKPLSVMPNAGYPTISARSALYDGTPDYFARQMEKIVHAGAAIAGGCCGTTPDHIRALRDRLDAPLENWKKEEADAGQIPARIKEPNILDENKNNGVLSILVELDPPNNDHIASFLQGAARLQAAGADMLTIADNPIGRPRADSSLLACKIRRELGMEVLPHMTCRDRNLNALKALLIGLSIEDVHQVLLVTGDPLPLESRKDVQAVFSFNSRVLAKYVRQLEKDGICQPFHAFAALDLNARNFQVQLEIARQKEQAGIEGFLTQPIFSQRALENLILARKELNGKIYGGLMPIVSFRNAQFLKNEISGMDIPDELASAYKDKNREECEAISIDRLSSTARKILPYVDGYYLMTPFGRVAMMEELIARIKSMQKETKSSLCDNQEKQTGR